MYLYNEARVNRGRGLILLYELFRETRFNRHFHTDLGLAPLV